MIVLNLYILHSVKKFLGVYDLVDIWYAFLMSALTMQAHLPATSTRETRWYTNAQDSEEHSCAIPSFILTTKCYKVRSLLSYRFRVANSHKRGSHQGIIYRYNNHLQALDACRPPQSNKKSLKYGGKVNTSLNLGKQKLAFMTKHGKFVEQNRIDIQNWI